MNLTIFADIVDKIKHLHTTGKPRGLSTGWPSVDEYFTMQEGNLHIITGIPSSGKSELLDQLMLNTIALHDWHWTVFSPENWPLESHFQKLAEKWVGRPFFKQGHLEPINEKDLQLTAEFLSKAICFLEPGDGEMNVDAILEGVADSEKRHTTNAFLLDPWNDMEAETSKAVSETNYINSVLKKIRNFGRRHKIAMFLVAHPTKLTKKEDGSYPVPTPYDISGSAHFRNRADVCLSVWRDYQKNDGIIQLHIQKMRNKNLGKLGNVELNWLWSNGLFTEQKVDINDGWKYAVRNKLV